MSVMPCTIVHVRNAMALHYINIQPEPSKAIDRKTRMSKTGTDGKAITL